MHLIFWFIFVIVSYFTGTDEAVLRSFSHTDRYMKFISTNNWSNETHFTWILYPPWKYHNDLFNDISYKNSVEYFVINEEDHINNESYIETSKLTVCNEVNLTFYSKFSHSINKINFILFMYKHHVWNKEWEYVTNNSQWQLHRIQINITNKNEDIQFRFILISNLSHQIFIAITIPHITTNTNCQNLNQINKFQLKNLTSSGTNSTPHSFLLIIFGSVLFFIFITVMISFLYGIIKKQYYKWIRKQSSQRRKKGRRNVIRDESTILYYQTDTV